MGKKNPFSDLRTSIQAQQKVLNRDRMSDFKVTAQGLDAIVANMLTTQTGLGTKLSNVNQRGLEAMSRIAGRSDQRLNRTVNVGENIISNRYGTAVAADPNLLAGVRRTASSQGKVNAGQVKAGELQMRGANEAHDIIAAASEAAANSGTYELAQALRYRAKNDAELIAAQKTELAKMKLQSQLEWDMFKKQQDYQNKQLAKAQLQGIGLITDTAPGALFNLQTAIMQNDGIITTKDPQTGEEVQLNVNEMPPAEVANYLMTQNGLPPEAMPVMTKAVTYMTKQNMDPAAALTSAITQLYGDTKGFEEATAGMDKTIALGILASASTQREADFQAAVGQSSNPLDLNNYDWWRQGTSRIASWFPGGTPAY
jgi:hypothetical protein